HRQRPRPGSAAPQGRRHQLRGLPVRARFDVRLQGPRRTRPLQTRFLSAGAARARQAVTATLRAGDAHPGPRFRKGADMLLRHATPLRNLPSIQRHGLLCSKSQGRVEAVWLATEGKSSWAALYVAWRHGARIEAVLTLEVDVPRSWLRRSRKGLGYCTRDIPVVRLRRLFGFVELARSNATGQGEASSPVVHSAAPSG